MVLQGQRLHEWRRELEQSRASGRQSLRESMNRDPSIIRGARDSIQTMDLPGAPSVRLAEILGESGLPERCGHRVVNRLRIQRGRPHDGAARSDDHISSFEIEAPLSEIRCEGVGYECDECGSDRGVYRYSATHHIAGFEAVECVACGTELFREDWG